MIESLNPTDPNFEQELSIQPDDRTCTPYDTYPGIVFKILYPNMEYAAISQLVKHLTEKAKQIIKNNIYIETPGNGTHTVVLKDPQAVKRVLSALSYGPDNHLFR